MSATTLGHDGQMLVESGKHTEAIPKLTAALDSSRAPAWLIARSKAYVATAQFALALADANEAWHVAHARANRPLMADAQYRRAVAYLRLGRYADADRAAIWATRLAQGQPSKEQQDVTLQNVDAQGRYTAKLADMMEENNALQEERKEKGLGEAMKKGTAAERLANMILTVRGAALQKLGDAGVDDVGRRALATQVPDLEEAKRVVEAKEETATVTTAADAPATATPAAPPAPPAKLRMQDFQSTTNMTVSLFSKGVDASKLNVTFTSTTVAMQNLKYPDGTEQPFYIALEGEIDPDQSRYSVTPSKVELNLRKKTAGKWARLAKQGTEPGPTLEGVAAEAVEVSKPVQVSMPAEVSKPTPPSPSTTATTTATTTTPATTTAPAPTYPTSSKSGPKDWDHIADDDNEDESSQDINHFFKNLYKGATPEQQRAMMKSFIESNGTSLSTNWDDVKEGTVETVPPEGVDVKKWEA